MQFQRGTNQMKGNNDRTLMQFQAMAARFGIRVSKHASPVRQREFPVCPECRVTLSAGECVNRMCQISIHNYSLLPLRDSEQRT